MGVYKPCDGQTEDEMEAEIHKKDTEQIYWHAFSQEPCLYLGKVQNQLCKIQAKYYFFILCLKKRNHIEMIGKLHFSQN